MSVSHLARSIALTALALGLGGCQGAPPRAEPTRPQAAAELQGPPPPPWRPPPPPPDGFDWVRLQSGEWLKGRLSAMRRTVLEFDSSKLGSRNLSWSDVAELRSPHANTVVLDDRRTLTGTLLLHGDEVVIHTDAGPTTLPRADLLSIVPTRTRALDLWSGGVVFGLTSQSGNTEQLTTNLQARLRRRSPFSRIGGELIGNFGRARGVENANNQRASARWDLFVSRRWFLTPASIDFFRDPFQNVAYRLTPGAGGGYYAIDEPGLEWTLSERFGWRYERLESAPPGADDDDSTATALTGTHFAWKITSTVGLVVDYDLEVTLPDAHTDHHALAKVSVDLIGDLDLHVTFQWDRIGRPRRSSTRGVPERDDFRTSIGLGWDF